MIKQLLIVFFLGFSSGLPLALVSSTLQAWFADAGASIWVTSSLSLISFPYLYRFLWSPIIDRYSILKIGKRRGWIFCMQILIALGCYAMTWLQPQTSTMAMIILAFMLASCSATQDACIDAHRTEYLPLPLYGIGASIATCAYRIALLVSGGVALILAQHYGWVVTYRIMGSLMLLGMFAILLSPEPSKEHPKQSFLTSFVEPLNELFKRKDIFIFFMFIVLYKFGEAFTTTTSGIMMPFLIQGQGFSLETIGYVNKIWGVIAIVLGGLVGGVILMRYSLYRALFIFGLFQAITNLAFIALAVTHKQIFLLILAVISDNFVAGMGSTALVAFFMRFVDQRFTATQFSVLVALAGMPRVFSGPVGAFLQERVGWLGLYNIAFVLALSFIPFLYSLRHQQVFNREKYTNDQA